MKVDRFIRLVVGLLVALLFIVVIAGLLFVTESALNVWDRLLEGPRYLLYGYLVGMTGLVVAAVWLIVRLVIRREPRERGPVAAPLGKADIEDRLRTAERAGVRVEEAQAEMAELAARQASGSIHLCFFGEISTGKSSLIKALVPGADVQISATGGSTGDIRHYRWRDNEGRQILLTDVPGSGSVETELDQAAEEEAMRSQAVLFVTDGDLTRDESFTVKRLLSFDKPLILVLNKSDRYAPDVQALLMEKILDHLGELGSEFSTDQVVAVSAGGEMEVVEKQPDGSEATTSRTRPPDVGVLVVAINRLLDAGSPTLDIRRDRAVFRLAADKLQEAELEYREQRAEQIIRSSTRKAVIGALAAVSPGTDIVIQGYIGTAMTRELCSLFGAAPRDLDIEEFLTMSQSRAGRALPLSLAVAGNGLKAFPGAGTVAGGIVHAVAYGLIFDALGRSLVLTLKSHGRLDPETAANEFGEGISEHIEAGVRQVARMALDQDRRAD